MSDFRQDPINDQWISIASKRCDRPMEFVPLEKTAGEIVCPFCSGNEKETPEALATYRSDGTKILKGENCSQWIARVVNNKFPSFTLANATEPCEPSAVSAPTNNNRFVSETGCGAQELIVPSPRHVSSLSQLNQEELLVAFSVVQDRIGHLRELPSVKHAMLFLNCGSGAGASLSHIHFQLMGSPVLGNFLRERVGRNQRNVEETGCSIVESLMKQEIQEQHRIVELTDNFCVVCPFASRFAFQVRIIPRKPVSGFSMCTSGIRDELANICQRVTTRLEAVLEKPSYNLLLQMDPFSGSPDEETQNSPWYVEIFPRLTKAAGFEWGTDIWVNPVPPESAAEILRSV